ncbi:MAG: hypothetical protein A3K19_31380 [Lentisphaerae bacterium RIFOXYB12_FULL_65_16]|nr:MAG: hypothetical protein A3K18_09620 [Lentisphaerae bacterium RIFOXYA12_64_32]OGV87156.1 MAG: hypothetical protein A3K19_31380 [Lentisphaerae bacterium RIFOXYB12_FULL_65_16]
MGTTTRLGCSIATLFAVAAFAQTKPTLLVTFDNDFTGEGRQGAVVGKLVDQPVLTPGKFGQALKSGPDSGYVEYPTAGLFTAQGGTVEMWVCPLDWTPDAREFHVFFEMQAPAKDGWLILYKYFEGVRMLMLTAENVAGPFFSCAFPVPEWKPGDWHHIAGTWSTAGVMCYIDGKPAMKLPAAGALPRSLGETFRIGDHPWHIGRKTSSLVDDVRIYDRPLSPAHITAHAAGDYDTAVPLSPDSAVLRVSLSPDTSQVAATVFTGGADVDDAKVTARVAMVRKGDALPKNAQTVPFVAAQTTCNLAMLSTDPGEYEVVAELLVDSARVCELRKPVVVPELTWKGNRVGLEDKVLPPWTPLTLDGTTLNCWGRQYVFGQSALPVRITSADAELLARPMSLDVAVAGQPVVWTQQSMRAVSQSDTRAEFAGELKGKAGEKEVSFTTRIVAEYDGLVMVDLACADSANLAADKITLDIPVPKDRALYRHRYVPAWAGLVGNLPTGNGVVDKDAFICYAWLGDNDRGLFWMCESDQFWPNAESPNAFETVRTDNDVVLRFNLLASGQTLPADWKYSFGIQATPVKPIPKDWRKWRLTPGRNPTVHILWPTVQKDSLRYYGYPEATDPAAFTQRVAAFHANNTKVVPYLCLSYISAACPEWPYFEKFWAMGGVDSSSADVAAYGVGFASASPLGPDYSDFIVWKTAQFIERYDVDGVYHDNTHPYNSTNTDAGCGYWRGEQRRPTHPILGYRALYRRMYAVTKSLPRETFTMAHMSGKVTIPILAYDDSYLDGEHFRDRVQDHYPDVLPLDSFRAEYMGRQWGILPYFLPEFRGEYAKQVEPTRGLMAILMLHDVSPWPIWCNTEVMNQALAALDEFGYVDAEFLAYFDTVPPATTAMPDVYVSAYKRTDNRALLIVGNTGRADQTGDVRISTQRLGLPLGHVVSWPDKTPVPVSQDTVQLQVPGRGYRMLVVTAQAP